MDVRKSQTESSILRLGTHSERDFPVSLRHARKGASARIADDAIADDRPLVLILVLDDCLRGFEVLRDPHLGRGEYLILCVAWCLEHLDDRTILLSDRWRLCGRGVG